MIEQFKSPGASWNRQPLYVNGDDFRSDAHGIAVPYGIYDLLANRGTVFVGISHDTPEFAVDSLEKWWRQEGHKRYASAKELAILADAGGSNAPTCRGYGTGCSASSVSATDSPLPSPTIPPAPPNGTRLNIVSSARSARTGRVALWTVTRPSSTTSAPRAPLRACAFVRISFVSTTRLAQESLNARCVSFRSPKTPRSLDGTT